MFGEDAYLDAHWEDLNERHFDDGPYDNEDRHPEDDRDWDEDWDEDDYEPEDYYPLEDQHLDGMYEM